MTAWTYCDWNLPYGEPHGDVYDEREARRRYESGETVTVLVGDLRRPDVVAALELGGHVCEVAWLDPLQRRELTYVFAVKDDVAGWPSDQLLLEQARIAQYDHVDTLPGARPTYTEAYTFHRDRRYYGMRQHGPGADLEQTEGVLDEDQFRAQLEPVPVFGKWESLLRRER